MSRGDLPGSPKCRTQPAYNTSPGPHLAPPRGARVCEPYWGAVFLKSCLGAQAPTSPADATWTAGRPVFAPSEPFLKLLLVPPFTNPHHLAGLHWCKRRASVGTGRRHWALRTGCQPLLCGRSQVWVLSNHCARIRGGPTAEARRRSVTSPSDVDPCPEMAQGPEQQGGNLNPFASPRRVRAAAPQ